MIELSSVQVKINKFVVSETTPTPQGTIAAVTIDVDVELDATDAERFGGLARALEAVIADANSRNDSGENEKDTIKLGIKRALPSMSYTLARPGAENDDEGEATMFDPSNPGSPLARKLTFVGDAKNASARVVKGVLSASWKIDAKLKPGQIAALSAMVKTAEVLISSSSVQGKLALDEAKREESRKGTGKAAGETTGRGRKTRRPAIAEAADYLTPQQLAN